VTGYSWSKDGLNACTRYANAPFDDELYAIAAESKQTVIEVNERVSFLDDKMIRNRGLAQKTSSARP